MSAESHEPWRSFVILGLCLLVALVSVSMLIGSGALSN